MATHCSILAWRIPGTEEPGGLPSMGSHRVGHNWSDLAAAAYFFLTGKFHGQKSLVGYGPQGWRVGHDWTHTHVLFQILSAFRLLQNIEQSFWIFLHSLQFSSVTQLCPTLCDPMNCSTSPPCPSPSPRVHPNPCPLSRWCHPTISSSVIPFSSCPQSFPASGSFPMSQLFASGGQSIGVAASKSVLPMNTKDWSPLGWTGWISLQSKGFSRVFSNIAVQKHQFFGTQLSL